MGLFGQLKAATREPAAEAAHGPSGFSGHQSSGCGQCLSVFGGETTGSNSCITPPGCPLTGAVVSMLPAWSAQTRCLYHACPCANRRPDVITSKTRTQEWAALQSEWRFLQVQGAQHWGHMRRLGRGARLTEHLRSCFSLSEGLEAPITAGIDKSRTKWAGTMHAAAPGCSPALPPSGFQQAVFFFFGPPSHILWRIKWPLLVNMFIAGLITIDQVRN